MFSSTKLQHTPDDVDFDDLMKSLTDNFNILADEVQLLSDRKTILEHKLRFAHEQYQQLADKYAPASPDIITTLAALQLPPDLHVQTPDRATFVPLPSRRPTGSKQQTAEAIRDGRRAAQTLAKARGWLPASESGGRSTTGTANSTMRTSQRGTSATTILEQDFTVPGKMSKLQCPFAPPAGAVKPTGLFPTASPMGTRGSAKSDKETSPHPPGDPICAALYSDTHTQPSAEPSVSGSAKCPIRYLDHHSPEEVAQYFETHKHEIPRSHEICVKRYQRNEDDIRKLDAKYGNIVSMIQGLGVKHQPMLPVNGVTQEMEEDGQDREAERRSNERVENWAEAVSSNGAEPEEAGPATGDDDEREGRFDRPLKEIRVGESPSRPWGIAVPYTESPAVEPQEFARPPMSTPAAPVAMPSMDRVPEATPTRPAGKCPFDHMSLKKPAVPTSKDPAPQNISPAVVVPMAEKLDKAADAQPTFFQHDEVNKLAAQTGNANGPQMVFTGPVFIGYPIDQAMTLMQQWQKGMTNPKS